MPTMSRSPGLANSTASSEVSSPPNTRCRSCLAGRLGMLRAVMIDLSKPSGTRVAIARSRPTLHLPCRLSASEVFCDRVAARSLKTAAQELAESLRARWDGRACPAAPPARPRGSLRRSGTGGGERHVGDEPDQHEPA